MEKRYHDLLKHTDSILSDLNRGTSVSKVFCAHKENLIRSSTEQKYFLMELLLDQIGPWKPRLDFIYHVVRMPSFVYDKTQNAVPFLRTLAQSSYWLDQELFDTRLLREKRNSNQTLSQQAHLLLLDIGSTLIGKGFPLNHLTLRPTLNIGNSHIQTWSHTFLDQCRERYAFMKNRAVCRQPIFKKAGPSPSKTRA